MGLGSARSGLNPKNLALAISGAVAMTGPLNDLKAFMEDHNAAIMTVLLGFLGLSNVGKGLGGLIG